jgi:Tol biopolymer transport system component
MVDGQPVNEFTQQDSILFSVSPGISDTYALYLINKDGSGSECLSCEIGISPQSSISSDPKFWSPTWRFDGKSYAYVVKNRPADGIVLREAGKTDSVLVSQKNAWYDSLDWSPNGQYIVYSRNNNIDDRVDVCYISAIDTNSQNERCAPVVNNNKINAYPTWSPDDINILFTSADDKYHFYLWNIEDNSITQFTDISGDDLLGKWSPDGTQFAYIVGTRVSESGFVPYQYDLFIADADGTNSQIVPNTNAAYDFDWSPDGKKIVFTQRSPIENDQCEVGCLPFTVLKIIDLETGEVTSLTDGTEWIGDPAWRP